MFNCEDCNAPKKSDSGTRCRPCWARYHSGLLSGRPAYNRGVPMPEEQKRAISQKLSGRALSEEHRANISVGLMGHAVSPKERARMSERMMGNTNTLGVIPVNALPLGTRRPTKNGYMRVKTERGMELEHRIVAGLVPGDGLIGHHRDHDKSNNDSANIKVVVGNAGHAREHQIGAV